MKGFKGLQGCGQNWFVVKKKKVKSIFLKKDLLL